MTNFYKIMKKINNLFKNSIIGLSSLLIALAVSVPAPLSAQSLITTSMSIGSSGQDVSRLQGFLSGDYHIYPAAIVSGYFGPLTQAAVRQFQVSFGIPTVGVVGPMTRSKVNEILSSGRTLDVSVPIMSGLSVNTDSNSVTVSLATSELSRVKVFYSTSPLTVTEATSPLVKHSISGQVSEDTSLKTSHSISINGLSGNTVYYFIVEATDASLNSSVTSQSSFETD